MEASRRTATIDALLAGALACVLTAAWTWRDWGDLSVLRLPDADDLMRLQQIRDWLGGQAFSDLTQYRLGAGGVAMHWSRLADLVPAAIIWALEGSIGRHQAELAAVIAWPAMLLAAVIALTARIARVVGGADVARPAMIVGAIAFPASTLFLPGRIDHHGLQLVLLLLIVLMATGRASIGAGLVAGVSTALSLVIGIEMAPLLAAAAAISVAEWTTGGEAERNRLIGFGTGLGAATLGASLVFRTLAWTYPACDGFTAIVARAAMLAAIVPIALAWFGRRARARVRVLLGFSGAIALAVALAMTAPECLSPYGNVDSLLQQLWLRRVAEAQGLFDAPPSTALGYVGLTTAGILASIWFAMRTHDRGWTSLLTLQVVAAAVTVAQLRGAYAGALLAAPALGALIVEARRVGALALVGAWAVSAGTFYPLAAQAMPRSETGAVGASCTAPDVIAALGKLSPGVVMAPIDTGAPAIASTDQRLIAGAYHRDGVGDLAMYSFYRGAPEAARTIAERWHVRWVVACDGFAGVSAPFARRLERGAVPGWLHEVVRVPSGGRIFAVVGSSEPARDVKRSSSILSDDASHGQSIAPLAYDDGG
jgi:hypothetical protein